MPRQINRDRRDFFRPAVIAFAAVVLTVLGGMAVAQQDSIP